MKKFLFAALAVATLALVGCDKPCEICGEKPCVCEVCDVCGENPCTCEEDGYVNPINITDGSAADWDALPAAFVATTTHAEGASMDGLKSVKVYADEMYINLLVEVNSEVVTDLAWTPFHVYINADNNSATGGFGDQWITADVDVMLETAIFADGAVNAYNPAVFKWWGADGENGWLWDDPENPGNADNGWGAIVPEGTMPIGTAQAVEGGKIEIQLLWELIPANWADKFTVGFDIQQSWTSCGILPNAADAEDGSEVLAEKLEVTFNK